MSDLLLYFCNKILVAKIATTSLAFSLYSYNKSFCFNHKTFAKARRCVVFLQQDICCFFFATETMLRKLIDAS